MSYPSFARKSWLSVPFPPDNDEYWQRDSPLLSLPQELQNEIYQYLLVGGRPIEFWPRIFAVSASEYGLADPRRRFWMRPVGRSFTKAALGEIDRMQ